VLDGAAAAINLGGAGVGDKRWTGDYKHLILQSRLETTSAMSSAVAAHGGAVALVNASAIGFYGNRGDEVLDERSHSGPGFLADVVKAWEAATEPAQAAGARVALTRTGLVQTRLGGSLARTLPLFKLGLGGRLGSGKQWWSPISLNDTVRAIEFLAVGDHHGPFNLTCPTPLRNSDFTKALGNAVGRPTVFAVPSPAIKVVLGEFANDVMGSQRVRPQALLDAGFEFNHPDAASILAAAIEDQQDLPVG